MLNAFPSITAAEFSEACQALERICHDRLHGTGWRSVRWRGDDEELELLIHAVGSSGCDRGDGQTPTLLSTDDQIASDEEAFIGPNASTEEPGSLYQDDYEEMNLEDEDSDVVVNRSVSSQNDASFAQSSEVMYSIVLSPTYRVPVLWFWIPSSPVVRSKDLEEIYDRLVTSHTRNALKGVGVMGGISIANHPLTDKACFFLHPCNTPEALESIRAPDMEMDPFAYLLLWIGLIGSAVGLHVPSQILA